MSGQLNLLAPPDEEPLVVPITSSVLCSGSRAHVEGEIDRPLFPHLHVPPRPARLPDDRTWLLALDFAEEQLRFKQAGIALLDLGGANGSGCCAGRCGPDTPMLSASSRGVEVDGALATWPRLLSGRAEQREVEFDLARARDLAQAYHYLDYYGRVYGGRDDSENLGSEGRAWSPVPMIRRLAEEAVRLGGEPLRLPFHTAYMRSGVEASTR